MKSERVVIGNEGDSSTLTSPSGASSPCVRIYRDDQQFGPYSLEQVLAFLREGVFAAGDLAWIDGGHGYVPIENLSDLMAGSPRQMEVTMRSM